MQVADTLGPSRVLEKMTADGQRFVLLKSTDEGTGAQTPDLYLVQHWSATLTR